jgi:CRISPR-associated protein Csd1
MEHVDLTPRNVRFTINIDADGNIDTQTPVSPLTSADGKQKFRTMLCPAFPGEKNGGKADFLFETPGRILGTETEEIAKKTHESFWALVREAKEATGDAGLEAVLKSREKIRSIAQEFRPDDTSLVTFSIQGEPVFAPDSSVRRWHRDHYFSLMMPEEGDRSSAHGRCLVTGEEASIATGHPVIKGVPGTQAKGGRLISYEKSDVTLNCFGR